MGLLDDHTNATIALHGGQLARRQLVNALLPQLTQQLLLGHQFPAPGVAKQVSGLHER
jgi:hypothetical protein